MKTNIGLLLLSLFLLVPEIGFCQTSASLYEPLDNSDFTQESNSKIAISVNPLGFVQFGPVINAEFGIKEDIVINTHVRFSVLGVLTHVTKNHSDGLDDLGGIAFGGGVIKFFGEKRNKPYVGILLEYDQSSTLYAQNEQWEWYQIDWSSVFIFNIGYRFRFDGSFFINTGAFFGASARIYNWEYSIASYGSNDYTPRNGTSVTPFGMLEVTLGMEF